MELRDLVMSSIKELDEKFELEKNVVIKKSLHLEDEREFLGFVKSRVEVLFMGLKTPEVINVEDKLEITLKFLEFLLSIIDEREQKLSKLTS